MWELNSGHLEGHLEFSAAEPSLQPMKVYFILHFYIPALDHGPLLCLNESVCVCTLIEKRRKKSRYMPNFK